MLYYLSIGGHDYTPTPLNSKSLYDLLLTCIATGVLKMHEGNQWYIEPPYGREQVFIHEGQFVAITTSKRIHLRHCSYVIF